MASGEPSDFVKKTIARKFEGKNLYAIPDESDDNDQGGGAPLYSPTEDSDQGGGVPLYSPTGDSDQGGGAPLYSPTVTDKTDGDSISTHHTSNGPEEISAATPAQPVVASVNAQAAQRYPVTSDGRFSAASAGQPSNVYGHNGGNRGNAVHPTAYQMLQQQYYQGYAHGASTSDNVHLSMYPQYRGNTVYSHQPMVNQQHHQPSNPHPATYQSPASQGQTYIGTMGSPTRNYAKTDMTPKHAATPESQLGTPYTAGPYTQTEPRNFAPRAHANLFVPPPQFMLQGASSVDGTRRVTGGSDDPFLSSSPNKERAVMASSSRDILPPVREADESPHEPLPAAPVSAEIRALRSHHLNKLTEGAMGLPTAEDALNPANFPFIESCTQSEPVTYGVVKIKNIPFATMRREIVAFFGRNSRILNDYQEPVHIIMERVTSKTLDAYVEFITLQDAMKAVERHNTTLNRGRLARLGDRPVEVELSSQSHMMADLFPLASGVMWQGSEPQIQPPIDDQPWTEFKGFITEEEMTMLVKHVEIPHRSPYSRDCPQRPFECMISTIKKLPWHMSDRITMRQRWAIYNVTFRLLEHARDISVRPRTPVQENTINEQLQKRLLRAAMLCPGFSVTQKDNIAYMMNMPDQDQRGFNQPRFPELWTFEQGICPKPGYPLDLLEWYIAIIREDTTRYVNRKPINERSSIEAAARKVSSLYFGHLWYEIGYPSGVEFDEMTLHQAAALELSAIERVLQRALPKTK